MPVKMPNSNFKERSQEFNTGVGKCKCDQTFEYTSERDMKNEALNTSQILYVPILQKVSIR